MPLTNRDPSNDNNPGGLFYLDNMYRNSYGANSGLGVYNGNNSLLSGLNTFGNTFGGWGNIFQGIGTIGNLATSIYGLGLQSRAIDNAEDSLDATRRLNTINLQNQAKAYNANMQDTLTTRAKANTGDSTAYNDLIESRKLDENVSV